MFVTLLDDCKEGEVRLLNGTDESNGRVEFCKDGIWVTLTICWWNEDVASIICKQLGYPYEGLYKNCMYYTCHVKLFHLLIQKMWKLQLCLVDQGDLCFMEATSAVERRKHFHSANLRIGFIVW